MVCLLCLSSQVMVVPVMVTIMAISARFRFEQRFDRSEPRTQPAQRVLEHVVAPNAQRVADHLRVSVAVADVPGEAASCVRIGARISSSRLPARARWRRRRGQTIAVAQRGCLRQVEQEPVPRPHRSADSPAMALVGIEHDAVSAARFDQLRQRA